MRTLQAYKERGLLVGETGRNAKRPPRTSGEHQLYGHVPIWAHLRPQYANPFAEGSTALPLFDPPTAEDGLGHYLKNTRCFVFLGADRSPVFDALNVDKNLLTLVFDPDPAAMAALVAQLDPEEQRRANSLFFSGPLEGLGSSLVKELPPVISEFGFPVFLTRPDMPETSGAYVQSVVEQLEIFYYRNRIYPLMGQGDLKGWPFRQLKAEITFDQTKHFYENISWFTASGVVDDLRGIMTGATAILAGAGPDLDNKIEFIRENMDKAVVIAVNTATRTLVRHGIEPHFTVINDTSVDVERTVSDLPKLERGILVPLCLAPVGRDAFSRMYFFGSYMPHLFGERFMLPLHGSVIATAFSLAELLGCRRCLLVGAQLASYNPNAFTYSRHSVHGEARPKDVTWLKYKGVKHTIMLPKTNARGEPIYTSPNFLDATYWFMDRVAETGLEVVNTTADTVLFGKHVAVDEQATVEHPFPVDAVVDALKPSPPNMNLYRIVEYVQSELEDWRRVRKIARSMLEAMASGSDVEANAKELIAQFDDDNTSHLLERYPGFSSSQFHALYFQGDTLERRAGAKYYFTHLEKMAKDFFDILLAQLTVLKENPTIHYSSAPFNEAP